jgi:F-type H+-transporting ATPase subunit gamma
MGDFPTYQDAAKIGQDLINIYNSRKVDKIYLVFNHFKSAMEHNSVEHILLPIQQDEVINQAERSGAVIYDEYIFEPSPKDVLFSLLPNYIETLVFRSLMESSASENGARRTAMKSASDNAVEIIDNLKRSYNRMRQAQITQEIAEVVGGAEALRT